MASRGGQRGKGDFRQRLYMNPPPEAVAGALGRFAEELSDWRPVWPRVVHEVMIPGLRENIAGRGAPIGETWRPADPRYLRRKRRQGFGSRELARTGEMLRELSSDAGVIKVARRSVTFETRARQARAVNFGFVTERGQLRVRPRRFMGWSAAMTGAATGIMNERVAPHTLTWAPLWMRLRGRGRP